MLTERCVTVSSNSSSSSGTTRWAGQVHNTNGARVSTTFGLKSVVKDREVCWKYPTGPKGGG